MAPARPSHPAGLPLRTDVTQPHLHVVTLNLFAHHANWPQRRAVLQAGLRALRPDLIAFQEAITSDTYDQVAELLGTDYVVAHQTRGLLGDGNHGASIASCWPLITVHDVDLQVPHRRLDYPCGTLVAEVQAPPPFGPLLFVSHGPWYPWWAEHVREHQAVSAARFIEQLVAAQERHVVGGGDFNATPDTASVRFWRGLQSLQGTSVCFQDCWDVAPGQAGHTHSRRNPLVAEAGTPLEPGRRIDYLLVRCGDHGPTLDVARCALLFDAPTDGVWASDHCGVAADLVLPPHDAAAMI